MVKKFTIRNIRTNQVLTIEGTSLLSALKSEGLNPDKWVEVKAKTQPEPEVPEPPTD